MKKSLLEQVADAIPQAAKEELDSLNLKKTKKGNVYVFNGIEELDKTNREIADKGGSVFDQYHYEDICIHGFNYSDCMICD